MDSSQTSDASPARADRFRRSGTARRTAVPAAIGWWLLGVAAMILAMAVIGAITRLTESGLSIVVWEPIGGALPPMSEAEWERLFALYREIPQYTEINRGMTLAEFKGIFWWEYIHRLWGRLIGFAFLLPLLWFWWRGMIARPMLPKLIGLFLLGGLQGVLGWFMVQSGLAERVDVSQYRLAAHLMLAVLIYALVLWVALDILWPRGADPADARSASLRRRCWPVLGLVALTMTSGAFVAGLSAGLTYNTFPLMDGRWIPAGLGLLSPWWANLFENVVAVQFTHRILAFATLAAVVWLWLHLRAGSGDPAVRRSADAVLGLGILQVCLGIATLLLAVPIPLGAAHQAGAILLLTSVLVAAHRLSPRQDAAGASPAHSGIGQP